MGVTLIIESREKSMLAMFVIDLHQNIHISLSSTLILEVCLQHVQIWLAP